MNTNEFDSTSFFISEKRVNFFCLFHLYVRLTSTKKRGLKKDDIVNLFLDWMKFSSFIIHEIRVKGLLLITAFFEPFFQQNQNKANKQKQKKIHNNIFFYLVLVNNQVCIYWNGLGINLGVWSI